MNTIGWWLSQRDRLEADGGEMVILVDHQMPVVGNDIVNLALAYQTLENAHIDKTARLASGLKGRFFRPRDGQVVRECAPLWTSRASNPLRSLPLTDGHITGCDRTT